MKKIIYLLCFVISAFTINAQQVKTSAKARAIINYNPEKSGENNIDYNSSFIISGLTIIDPKAVSEDILKKNKIIEELSFTTMENNKGTMVKLHLFAKDKMSLTNELKSILKELGVNEVESNGNVYSTIDSFKL